MKIKIFGKKSCAICETTKNKFGHFLKKNDYGDSVALEFHDMDTVDGMAEGSYYDVLKIPTTVIEKEDKILARWDGEVPRTEEFKEYMVPLSAGDSVMDYPPTDVEVPKIEEFKVPLSAGDYRPADA